MGASMREIPKGAVDPTCENLLVLIPQLALVATLNLTLEEGGV